MASVIDTIVEAVGNRELAEMYMEMIKNGVGELGDVRGKKATILAAGGSVSKEL